MDGLIAYLERRKKRCQEQLALADTPGFLLRQSIPGFPDTDVTEQYRASLRIAITDYQHMIRHSCETHGP